MSADEEINPRGMGTNWYPCFICGHKPLQHAQPDQSGFVDASLVQVLGDVPLHPIANLVFSAGLVGTLDYRVHEPQWVQYKFGACGEHAPNLELLGLLVKANNGKITKALIERCIPGRKLP